MARICVREHRDRKTPPLWHHGMADNWLEDSFGCREWVYIQRGDKQTSVHVIKYLSDINQSSNRVFQTMINISHRISYGGNFTHPHLDRKRRNYEIKYGLSFSRNIINCCFWVGDKRNATPKGRVVRNILLSTRNREIQQY